MGVTEAEAIQAALSFIDGDPTELIDAYHDLLGHRTRYELVNQHHSNSLLPVGREAIVIARLMGKEKYILAHTLLRKVIQLMQAGGDGSSTQVFNSN